MSDELTDDIRDCNLREALANERRCVVFWQRRCEEAELQLTAERAARERLVAEWRAADDRDPWSNGYAKAADQLAALDQSPASGEGRDGG